MKREEIKRINGNKQEYVTGLPKIIILGSEKWNKIALKHVEENTGLDFSTGSAQPENSNQITTLFLTYNFKTRYYNNGSWENVLFLKSDHHTGFDVDSICFDCCKQNNINTNGLEQDSRLAC